MSQPFQRLRSLRVSLQRRVVDGLLGFKGGRTGCILRLFGGSIDVASHRLSKITNIGLDGRNFASFLHQSKHQRTDVGLIDESSALVLRNGEPCEHRNLGHAVERNPSENGPKEAFDSLNDGVGHPITKPLRCDMTGWVVMR
jgi:hypothetical protein